MSLPHPRPASPSRPPLLRRLLTLLASLTIALGIALTALVTWPLPPMPRPGISADFLVRRVAVVDVVRGEVLPDRDVVVRSGRITYVGDPLADSAQHGLVIVDGHGKFLMPSLWDMHVHSLTIAPQYTHPLSIANGVTGVREMWGCPALPDSFVACGDDIERWRSELQSGAHLAPRYIQRSSYAINGADGTPVAAPAYFNARNAAEARALVAHQDSAGVDLLKVYTNVSVEAYDALADEAMRRGLLFAGHLPIRVSLERAMAAGQRSIEHPRIFLLECYPGAAAFRALPDPMAAYSLDLRAQFIDRHDRARCAELMSAMAASNTWWTPTVQVLRMSALSGDQKFRDDPRGRYIPFFFWSFLWKMDADNAVEESKRMPGRDVHGELYRLALDNVRQAHAAGVQIVAGTDAGDSYVFPGFAIHDELTELVRAGLTPVEALRTATITAARFAGKDADYGSIEQGKVADMLLLSANPLQEIRSTASIAGLFFNGQYLDRSALDALLIFAEEQAGSLRGNLQLVWRALRSPVIRAQAAD